MSGMLGWWCGWPTALYRQPNSKLKKKQNFSFILVVRPGHRGHLDLAFVDFEMNSEHYKSSYFRVKLKRIKFERYIEPDLDQT